MDSRRGLGGEVSVNVNRGTLVLVDLNPTIGHEQQGVRPCIVVSNPNVIDNQRFGLVCIVPVTGTPGEGLLYPLLEPGNSGLKKRSYALIDNLRSIDKRRITRVFGVLAKQELTAVNEGLAAFLGLHASSQMV